MVDRLKRMKETLASAVEGQLGNLKEVDAKELGEVVDMVKDLEEAIYYCSITKAMEESEKKEKEKVEHHYYTRPVYPERSFIYPDYPMMYYDERPRDSQGRFVDTGRRYYDMGPGGSGSGSSGNSGGGSGSSGMSSGSGSRGYMEREILPYMRDNREGRSPISRRMYMESKQMHKDKATKLQDLENYTKELTEDITEMIQDASPEEKQVLERKLTTLASKIGTLAK